MKKKKPFPRRHYANEHFLLQLDKLKKKKKIVLKRKEKFFEIYSFCTKKCQRNYSDFLNCASFNKVISLVRMTFFFFFLSFSLIYCENVYYSCKTMLVTSPLKAQGEMSKKKKEGKCIILLPPFFRMS